MTPYDAILAVAVVVLSIVVVVLHRKITRIEQASQNKDNESVQASGFVLDTSALLDQRFLQLYATLGLTANLYLPSNVLAELKTFIDSKAKEYSSQKVTSKIVLTKLETLKSVKVMNQFEELDADEQVIKLAHSQHATVVSLDKALLDVAKIQDISTCNPNNLVQKVKPERSLGETVEVSVIGKVSKSRQAIGVSSKDELFIIHNASKYSGSTAHVVVTKKYPKGSSVSYQAKLEGS